MDAAGELDMLGNKVLNLGTLPEVKVLKVDVVRGHAALVQGALETLNHPTGAAHVDRSLGQ